MLEIGRVTLSLKGRDRDCYYVVTAVDKDGCCYIANGRGRKLASPKKKNPRHLRATATLLSPERYRTDRELRRTLMGMSE